MFYLERIHAIVGLGVSGHLASRFSGLFQNLELALALHLETLINYEHQLINYKWTRFNYLRFGKNLAGLGQGGRLDQSLVLPVFGVLDPRLKLLDPGLELGPELDILRELGALGFDFLGRHLATMAKQGRCFAFYHGRP